MTPILASIRRLVLCAVIGTCVPGLASAQSGRCLLEGIVVGGDEVEHIHGATVELIGDSADAHTRGVRLTTTTGGDGRYGVKEIPYGPYTLRVSAPGYRAYRIPIYMLSDCKTQLYVRLTRARAAGRR